MNAASLIANRYEILTRLGQGGMGTVYKARDHRLKRDVAMKVLVSAPEADTVEHEANAAYFFLREARAAGSLSHPNIVGVFDYAAPGDEPLYLVMELVEGDNLHVHIETRSPLPELVMWAVLQQIAAALAHAHERGVMHRDVKPGNVLLATDGRVVLTDFGLAKAYRDAGAFGRTVAGRATEVFGTPTFMAPEQVQDGEAGPESDVFSLGCVLYAMGTGASPFASENLEEGLERLVQVRYAPLRERRPDLSEAMSEVLSRCLNGDILDRADAKEVETAASRALAEAGYHDPRAVIAAFLAEGEGEGRAAAATPLPTVSEPTIPYAEQGTERAPPPTLWRELPAGTMIEGYEILRLAGAGAMGHVYAAQHPIIGRKAAIKVLNNELHPEADGLQRFVREARVVVEIGHPGIVDIFAFGRLSDGRPYLVMEWLEGQNLATWLKGGPLPLLTAARMTVQVADALQAAHGRGVLHRDVKPANILLQGDVASGDVTAKLLDFGIAKVMEGEDDPTATQSGVILGTPGYLSPEQARRETLDGRTDIYALGAVLYEAVLGRPVFSGASGLEVISKHLNRAPSPPVEHWDELPQPVNTLILRMLAKEPAERPSLQEVKEVLKQCIGSTAPGLRAPPESGVATQKRAGAKEPQRRRRSVRRWVGIGAAVGASAFGLALGWLSMKGSEPEPISSSSPPRAESPSSAASDHRPPSLAATDHEPSSSAATGHQPPSPAAPGHGRDMFGHQRLREQKYTPGQIDTRWSDEIEKDFSQWLNEHIDELPVPKEQIQELLKTRTW